MAGDSVGVSKPEDETHALHDLTLAARRFGAVLDGPPFISTGSVGSAVLTEHGRRYVKVAQSQEGFRGIQALKLWAGMGAVRVISQDGNAALLEHAGPSLRSIAPTDAELTAVLCDVASRLHSQQIKLPTGFHSVERWFTALLTDESREFLPARCICTRLINDWTSHVLLHGDLRSGNVLHGGDRGWLAINPKGIVGPRQLDFCNIFTNHDARDSLRYFESRLRHVCALATIDRMDLLRWIAAWAALSCLWHLQDGSAQSAASARAVMNRALVAL